MTVEQEESRRMTVDVPMCHDALAEALQWVTAGEQLDYPTDDPDGTQEWAVWRLCRKVMDEIQDPTVPRDTGVTHGIISSARSGDDR